MAEFRAGLIADIPASEVTDEEIGALLDLLKHHDGALETEVDRIVLVFSFDAAVPTGFAPGVIQAVPRATAIGRSILIQAGLVTRATVIGISVEKVGP